MAKKATPKKAPSKATTKKTPAKTTPAPKDTGKTKEVKAPGVIATMVALLSGLG